MEDKYVYITDAPFAERKAKVAAIEGLAELRAAIAGKKSGGEINELLAKYPRAAAYLKAEVWIYSENPVQVRLASCALEKILNGEDPEAVILEMSQGLDAFFLAQEG